MTGKISGDANLVFSPGTRVVTCSALCTPIGKVLHPNGSVAVVLRSPDSIAGEYRLKFHDGLEATLPAREVLLLAKFTESETQNPSHVDQASLFERVIYRCVLGSRAYGLDDENSDVDYRGVYLPTAEQHWSMHSVPGQLERHSTQETYWELQKFLTLALKANPIALETLHSSIVLFASPLALELIAIREAFLSRLLYQTFSGYVTSQFRRMHAEIRNHERVKWKHVMHLLRLLLAGIHVLEHGEVRLQIPEHRDELLAIKRGEVPWEETERRRLDLQSQFELAWSRTRLPEKPDYQRVDEFLIKARRAALAETLP